MEKITHIICFAVKLIIALLIVGGMVFIITVNSVCRTAFYFFHSHEGTCELYEEHVGAKGGKIRTIGFYYTMDGKLMTGEAYVMKKYNTGQKLQVII